MSSRHQWLTIVIFSAVLICGVRAFAVQGGFGTNHLPPKAALPEVEFYIDATNGNDTQWPWYDRFSDPTRPYETVEALMAALLLMEAEMTTPVQGIDRPVTVWFREGTYELENTIEIGPELSGDPSVGIWLKFAAFRSDPTTADEVLISGGERITTWNEGAGCSNDASTQGATKSKWWGTGAVGHPISDLWVNNERATLAREPDIGDGILTTGFSIIEESKVHGSTFDRLYTIDTTLPLSFSVPPPSDGSEGYVEAVAISEWSVSRSLPDLYTTDPVSGFETNFVPTSGKATLRFFRTMPLGKICGGNQGEAIDPCTSMQEMFYQGFLTVRGNTHIQACPDSGIVPTGQYPHATSSMGLGMLGREDRLFVEGAKGFMDERFEWYQRRVGSQANEQINIRLPATQACVPEMDPRTDTSIVVPHLTKLIEIKGTGTATPQTPVAGVHLKDLMFAHTNWTRAGVHYGVQADYELMTFNARGAMRLGLCDQQPPAEDGKNLPPAAIEVQYGQGIVIEGCRFAHTAANAINAFPPIVPFDHTATHSRPSETAVELTGVVVRGNEFFDIGGSAIALGKFGTEYFRSTTIGDFKHTHVGPFYISNNLIHNPTVLSDYSVGVRTISSAGIRADVTQDVYLYNNEIIETPDAGIFGGGVNNGVYNVTAFLCANPDYTTSPACNQVYMTRSSGSGYSYRGLQGDFFVSQNRLDENVGLITDGASIYVRSAPGSARPGFVPGTTWGVGGSDVTPIPVRADSAEAVISENYVSNVAPLGVTGGNNTVAGLYFDNCSANWKVFENSFSESQDWVYVQIGVEGSSAFPASFSWGVNYFDLEHPLAFPQPSSPPPTHPCLTPELDARWHIENRLFNRAGCEDYFSVIPANRFHSRWTGCPPPCQPGPCTGTHPTAVQVENEAGLYDPDWGYLKTDTSPLIHP